MQPPLSIICLLLACSTIYGKAQQTYLAHVQHYGIKEGLSHREVFAIHQDQKGFIWLGTKYGLNRFDGKEFKWWTKEKQKLASNEIHHILEDAEGYLWTFTVPNWYYPHAPLHWSLVQSKTGEIISPEEKFGADLPFEIGDVTRFLQGKDHTLYFDTRDGILYCYRPEDGFRPILLPNDAGFFPLLGTAEGHLIGSLQDDNTLLEVDKKGNIIWEKTLDKRIREIQTFLPAGDKQFFLVVEKAEFEHELYLLDQEQQLQLVQHPDFDTAIEQAYTQWSWGIHRNEYTQDYWIYGAPYLQVLKPEQGILFRFEEKFKELAQSVIHDVYFDEQGNTWMATVNGLFKVQLYPNPFQRYLFSDSDYYEEANSYSCRGIWADGQHMLVNTYKGRIQLDQAQAEDFKHLPPVKDKNHSLLHFPLVLKKDSNGKFWFSEHYLIKQDSDLQNHQIWGYTNQAAASIWSFFEDDKGEIWLGTEKGLARLDTVSGAIAFVPSTGFESLSNSTIYAFVKSNLSNFIWLCTTQGLYAWQPEEGILDRYWRGGDAEHYLPHDQILHMQEDDMGVLWLATGGGGLIRVGINQENLTIDNYRQFTISDGLSNNNLYAVYADHFGSLWISSDYGLIQFDKTTYRARSYLPEDGVTHYEFNRISHFQDEAGYIYFGSLNGVTAFHPNDFQEGVKESHTPLEITDFQQMDGKTEKLQNRTKDLLQKGDIILQPGDRFFRLQFTLLDYSNPELVRYSWKIEGLDENWNYIDENFIRISGLSAGNYLLKIRGQSGNGQWSNQEIHLPLEVRKHFYEQAWFITLCTLILLSGGLVFYYWRTRQLKNRQAILEQLVQERTSTIHKQAEELRHLDQIKSRFFANVSHELRTPLSLILAPLSSALKSSELSNKTFTYLKLAQQNGQKLLQLVNEILDLAKLEQAKMELQESPVVLYTLLRRIIAGFESWAEHNQQHFEFYYKPSHYLKIQLDENKFEKILNNLLSNAFKFTPAGGSIQLNVEEYPNKIRILVNDTGRGIHPNDLPHIFDRFYQTKSPDAADEGGTGIGLALCQEFTRLMDGDIWVESDLSKGSTFFFEFPKKEVLGSLSTEEAEAVQKAKNTALLQPRQHDESTIAVGDKPTLLLVEDNSNLRQYMQLILSEHFQIITAENGRVALEKLTDKNLHPQADLIISDVMMPMMDGYQLLEQLKGDDRWRHIPVVMLTARAELRDKLKALRIGVDDYMLKPFVEEELLARIENLLKNSKARLGSTVLSNSEKDTPTISASDADWLERQEHLVQKELSNPNFTATQWAAKAALSERQLQRKLKTLAGLTPHQYLVEIRLLEARKLLEDHHYNTVAEVAYAVGFSQPQSLTRNFQKRFGRLPSSYM